MTTDSKLETGGPDHPIKDGSVTLTALRDHKACVAGYKKLVRTLQGKEFTQDDESRDTHIRYAHKEPIPLRTILDSNGFDDALWSLRACEQTLEMVRAERLFAVWCARQVQHLMTDQRSIEALEVAERHAHGNATDKELDAAGAAARGAALDAAGYVAGYVAWAAAGAAAGYVAWAAAGAAAWDAEWAAAGAAAWDAECAAECAAARAAARAAQKDMFIAVFCGEELNIDAMLAEQEKK